MTEISLSYDESPPRPDSHVITKVELAEKSELSARSEQSGQSGQSGQSKQSGPSKPSEQSRQYGQSGSGQPENRESWFSPRERFTEGSFFEPRNTGSGSGSGSGFGSVPALDPGSGPGPTSSFGPNLDLGENLIVDPKKKKLVPKLKNRPDARNASAPASAPDLEPASSLGRRVFQPAGDQGFRRVQVPAVHAPFSPLEDASGVESDELNLGMSDFAQEKGGHSLGGSEMDYETLSGADLEEGDASERASGRSSPVSHPPPPHENNAESTLKKKRELWYKLERLRERGYEGPNRLTLASSLAELEEEHDRLDNQRRLDNSIKFQRRMLMGVVSGIEYLNGCFDPFDLQLDGWSESIFENLSEYDDVFEELYEKYKSTVNLGPELNLLFMVLSSGVMFHWSKKMWASSSAQVPGFDQVMKNNPELKKAYQQAAMKEAAKSGAFAGMPFAGNEEQEQEPGFTGFVGNFLKRDFSRKKPKDNSTKSNAYERQEIKTGSDLDELLNELQDEMSHHELSSKGSKTGVSSDKSPESSKPPMVRKKVQKNNKVRADS
ncbi:MAG: hypothetical protein ACYCOU_04715 [Sulfobacillus sp.]